MMNGEHLLSVWLALFVASGIAAGIITGFLKARKIQPKGFKWKVFRNEIAFAVITLAITGLMLDTLKSQLVSVGLISFQKAPPSWWEIGLEYAKESIPAEPIGESA